MFDPKNMQFKIFGDLKLIDDIIISISKDRNKFRYKFIFILNFNFITYNISINICYLRIKKNKTEFQTSFNCFENII